MGYPDSGEWKKKRGGRTIVGVTHPRARRGREMPPIESPHESMERLRRFLGIPEDVPLRSIEVRAAMDDFATCKVEYLTEAESFGVPGSRAAFRLVPMGERPMGGAEIVRRLRESMASRGMAGAIRRDLEGLVREIEAREAPPLPSPEEQSVAATEHAEDLRDFFAR
jgi:hypothetical protein